MPPKPMKERAIPAEFTKALKSKFLLNSTNPSSPTTPAVRRPTLWAASSFWDSHGNIPCPLQVQAYDSDSTTFGNSHQSIKLLKNGDQFLMTGVVSLALYDESISQVDYIHNPSMWGGLQQSTIYVASNIGRYIVSAYSPLDNLTHSNPPEKILSFTTYFEAWQDNEELKLYSSAGFSSSHNHPVKLWSRLIRLQIIKL